jgi:hypothetical protein
MGAVASPHRTDSDSSTIESRAFWMVSLWCGETKTKQVPIGDLAAAVQAILREMPSGQAEVLKRRHGLDNEEMPIPSLVVLAERVDSTSQDTSRYLLRGEQAMLGSLRNRFPVLMADPDPTPQTH